MLQVVRETTGERFRRERGASSQLEQLGDLGKPGPMQPEEFTNRVGTAVVRRLCRGRGKAPVGIPRRYFEFRDQKHQRQFGGGRERKDPIPPAHGEREPAVEEERDIHSDPGRQPVGAANARNPVRNTGSDRSAPPLRPRFRPPRPRPPDPLPKLDPDPGKSSGRCFVKERKRSQDQIPAIGRNAGFVAIGARPGPPA